MPLSEELIVYYLEMTDTRLFLPKAFPPDFNVVKVDPPTISLNKKFYQSVGEIWRWTDRLNWTVDRWFKYVNNPNLETWVGNLYNDPVGYFELKKQSGGDVKIVYFGLLPKYIGKGLGGPLLSAAVERAWEMPDTLRVWVHTCTRDHKYALDNYLKRGFRIYKTDKFNSGPNSNKS